MIETPDAIIERAKTYAIEEPDGWSFEPPPGSGWTMVECDSAKAWWMRILVPLIEPPEDAPARGVSIRATNAADLDDGWSVVCWGPDGATDAAKGLSPAEAFTMAEVLSKTFCVVALAPPGWTEHFAAPPQAGR